MDIEKAFEEFAEDLEKVPLPEMVTVFAPFADRFSLGAT